MAVEAYLLCHSSYKPWQIVRTIPEKTVQPKHVCNRVGGKRSSFLPTFVFRPLTPPYVPLGIRRFRAFSSYDVWQVVFSHTFEIHHFYPIVGFRPIVWVESSFRTSDYKRLAGWQSFTFALLDSALPF